MKTLSYDKLIIITTKMGEEESLEQKAVGMARKNIVLVTGAAGQIGSELVPALRELYGHANVVAGWHRTEPTPELAIGPTEKVDVTDITALETVIKKYKINVVYHLASLLSAVGERDPALTWRVNGDGLLNVLELARRYGYKVFWPSSIAVFGPTTPIDNTPQETVMDPDTMYGVTKVAGEKMGLYYHIKHGVDFRSVRYPGLMSWKTKPGGGTTDNNNWMYFKAVEEGRYTSFLGQDTWLPMMHMPDAIRATVELMEVPAHKVRVRTSYNIAGVSYTAAMQAAEIRKHLPGFVIEYNTDTETGHIPDREKIAQGWPNSIDGSAARRDWGWNPEHDLPKMTVDMLNNLAKIQKAMSVGLQ